MSAGCLEKRLNFRSSGHFVEFHKKTPLDARLKKYEPHARRGEPNRRFAWKRVAFRFRQNSRLS
jgi:hypothetical protein